MFLFFLTFTPHYIFSVIGLKLFLKIAETFSKPYENNIRQRVARTWGILGETSEKSLFDWNIIEPLEQTYTMSNNCSSGKWTFGKLKSVLCDEVCLKILLKSPLVSYSVAGAWIMQIHLLKWRKKSLLLKYTHQLTLPYSWESHSITHNEEGKSWWAG